MKNLMMLSDILALTGASKPTIYRWMEKHPTLEESDTSTKLGHALPKPIKKEGRTVLWSRDAVTEWWEDNHETIGRHPKESATIMFPWSKYRAAMMVEPKIETEDGEEKVVDHMETVLSAEKQGKEVKLSFRDVNDAIMFKLKYS